MPDLFRICYYFRHSMTNQKTWVEISRSAYRHNLNVFRRKIGPSVQLMAILKSNAYGHGLQEIASLSQDLVDSYGVDSIEEAIKLRNLGIKQVILVLGYVPPERFSELAKHDLAFSLYNQETFDLIQSMPNLQFKAHLEIETGLTRQGIEAEDIQRFATQATKISNLQITGVMTHFANIEETKSNGYSQQQIERFSDAVDQIKKAGLNPDIIHTACSAAAWMEPKSLFNTVRLGLGQYGLWSSADMQSSDDKSVLRPIMTWKTRIAQIKEVKAGTPISYGMTEVVDHDSKVAVLPVGYWDGIDRVAYSSKGHVIIDGTRCKVLGRVCMNMMMVDITDVAAAKVNNEVTLLGNGISAEEIAQQMETINYEVVTRINPLIPRTITE